MGTQCPHEVYLLMTAKITFVANGALLKLQDEPRPEVFKFEDEDPGGLVDMLQALVDYSGYLGSRYSRQRIQVRIIHGDKYECNDKKCGLCK